MDISGKNIYVISWLAIWLSDYFTNSVLVITQGCKGQHRHPLHPISCRVGIGVAFPPANPECQTSLAHGQSCTKACVSEQVVKTSVFMWKKKIEEGEM